MKSDPQSEAETTTLRASRSPGSETGWALQHQTLNRHGNEEIQKIQVPKSTFEVGQDAAVASTRHS